MDVIAGQSDHPIEVWGLATSFGGVRAGAETPILQGTIRGVQGLSMILDLAGLLMVRLRHIGKNWTT